MCHPKLFPLLYSYPNKLKICIIISIPQDFARPLSTYSHVSSSCFFFLNIFWMRSMCVAISTLEVIQLFHYRYHYRKLFFIWVVYPFPVYVWFLLLSWSVLFFSLCSFVICVFLYSPCHHLVISVYCCYLNILSYSVLKWQTSWTLFYVCRPYFIDDSHFISPIATLWTISEPRWNLQPLQSSISHQLTITYS